MVTISNISSLILITVAGLGGNCTHDGECSGTKFSKCQESTKCTCTDNFVVSENASRCLAVATSPKMECFEDIQCSATLGSAAVCTSGTCKCKELYQLKKNTNRCVRDMCKYCKSKYLTSKGFHAINVATNKT